MAKPRLLVPKEPSIDLVRIISEGTYTSFASALKEFVSNAYDADAEIVRITIDENCDAISIHDDGHGMSLAEFRDAYVSIARCGKSLPGVQRGRTRKGRQKIGRFGIGALAVIHVADTFRVRSSKRGSRQGFEAEIDLRELRRRYGKGADLSEWWQFEYSEWHNEPINSHFTEVICTGLNEDTKQFLQRPGDKEIGKTFRTIRQLSGVDELTWQLGIICPVEYASTYPFPESDLSRPQDNLVFRKAGRLKKDRLSVLVNATPVTRRVFFPSYGNKTFSKAYEHDFAYQRGLGYEIRCLRSPAGLVPRFEGYLLVQAFQVFPEELRGLLVRIRGVGIGWHRTLNLQGKIPSVLAPNLSGEIWVEGLDEALQFDRESFREDHPLFLQLQRQIADVLEQEAIEFRQRSSRRQDLLHNAKAKESETKEKGQGEAKEGRGDKEATPQPAAEGKPEEREKHPRSGARDLLLPVDIFEQMGNVLPAFENLLNQINGCWERAYYDACALVCRRLLETMIIELYSRRGLGKELYNPDGKYVGLKKLINKLNGDQRFGLGKHFTDELSKVKTLGDLAAHDHMIRIRKPDFDKPVVQHSIERLAHLIGKEPPTK